MLNELLLVYNVWVVIAGRNENGSELNKRPNRERLDVVIDGKLELLTLSFHQSDYDWTVACGCVWGCREFLSILMWGDPLNLVHWWWTRDSVTVREKLMFASNLWSYAMMFLQLQPRCSPKLAQYNDCPIFSLVFLQGEPLNCNAWCLWTLLFVVVKESPCQLVTFMKFIDLITAKIIF